ncbi:MAG: hypothetical protein CMQ70_02620 [Gammaproteobacteria bacterium]|nr:hypothetical protein [Gammaproteobacteria bacterium]|tara:strand:- start:1226 stop:2464 length:1239 start_codon:yes stop_codon:yes gene_type:complete
MLSVSKNTIYSGIFFFFVLLSIFVLRPFRNTIAADIGTADLTFFLFIVVLVMLLVNPIYSFIVSKSSQKRLVPYIYGFFIINLLSFLVLNTYLPESFTVKATFYVWYNIFNFFLVAIFWAMTVNSFNIHGGKKFFGLISACGSLGASCGGFLVDSYLYDKQNLSLLITVFALCLAVYFSSKVEREEIQLKSNTSSTFEDIFEQFTQIRNNPLIRNFIFYAFTWTCLSTALWFFQLEIINSYTDDSAVKTKIFGRADSIVPIITLVTQLLLTSWILSNKFLGIRFVITIYGLLFVASFLAVSGYFSEYLLSASGITVFLVLQGTMRPFEYGLNKPAREAVFTTLSVKEKYKSTVFIDTFTNRFGDATGGLLFNSLLTMGLVLYTAPLAIIPLAIFLINLGWNISKNIDTEKST